MVRLRFLGGRLDIEGRVGRMIRAVTGIGGATIVNRAKRVSLLTRLCREQPFVTVGLSAAGGQFSSALMNVSADGTHVLLDELSSDTDRVTLSPRTKLYVRGHLDGRPLSFHAPVSCTEMHHGVPCYRLSGPRALHYRQQRASERHQPKSSTRVYLVDQGANLLMGTLRDISLGGFSVRIDDAKHAALDRGTTLTSCTLHLTSTTAVQGAVQIRHVTRWQESPTVEFGGRFLALNRRHREALQTYVAELEAA